jgi:tripartite-type tricarboxylate transporter receptor subunit TctC
LNIGENIMALTNVVRAGLAFLALCCVFGSDTAAAQEYPSKPIRIVVGFPPGGSNDVVARIFAPRLAEILGGPVIIENKPGANATIGTDFVAKAAPDGYTITLGSLSPLVLSLFTYPNIPYDTQKDFTPITTVALTPEIVAVHPSVPAKDLKELVELSKSKQVTLSSSGSGGLPHLAIELLKGLSKGNFLHVPYKGAGPAVTDTLAGHVNGIIIDLPALSSQVKDGKLRAIAVTNERRTDVLPNVATSVEQGFPGLVAVNWFALMAPAMTPKPIVDKLHGAVVKVTASPQMKEDLAKVGIEPFTMPSPEAFQKFLGEEIVRWGKIAKESGAKAD